MVTCAPRYLHVLYKRSNMARSVEEAIDKLMHVDDDGDEYELSTSGEEEVDGSLLPDEESQETTSSDNLTAVAPHSASTPAALPSLLTLLRPPKSSELSRKQVIDRNPPKGMK